MLTKDIIEEYEPEKKIEHPKEMKEAVATPNFEDLVTKPIHKVSEEVDELSTDKEIVEDSIDIIEKGKAHFVEEPPSLDVIKPIPESDKEPNNPSQSKKKNRKSKGRRKN